MSEEDREQRRRRDLKRSLLLLLRPQPSGETPPPDESPPLPASGASKLTRPPQQFRFMAGTARILIRGRQPSFIQEELRSEEIVEREPGLEEYADFEQLVEVVYLLTR